MRTKTHLRLKTVASVAAVSALIGTGFTPDLNRPLAVLASAATGATIGGLIALFEIAARGSAAAPLRRAPFWLAFLIRAAIYTIIIFGVGRFMRAATHDEEKLAAAVDIDIVSALFVAVAFNFAFALRRLIGPRPFFALLTGRYHRPRRENHLVLFLDLLGSTTLAERIGDAAFLSFLDRVYSDMSDTILEAGGEIYRYVGDEIIITWRLDEPHAAKALACLIDIRRLLAARGEYYRSAFGAEPRFRAGMHAGTLMVGEIGDLKREIILLGDTMNTAARIEDACRTFGRLTILSAPALAAVSPLPPGLAAEPLGEIPLRGKTAALELYAVEAG